MCPSFNCLAGLIKVISSFELHGVCLESWLAMDCLNFKMAVIASSVGSARQFPLQPVPGAF